MLVPTSALGAFVTLLSFLSFNDPSSSSVAASRAPPPHEAQRSGLVGPSRLHERRVTRNARIALYKRTGRRVPWAGLRLTLENGVVDLDNLQNAVARTEDKYGAGASRYHWRTGKRLPGFSLATYEKWAKLALAAPEAVADLVGLSKRQRNPLTNYLDGNLWAGKASIGSPPQEFTIVRSACPSVTLETEVHTFSLSQDFDTGSADFWVPGKGVTGFSTFDATASSTAKNTSDRFSISYGDGSTVSGPVYTDTVTVAGLSAENQHFSPVTDMGTDFGDTTVDGLMGLAFPTISNLGEKPFFQTLWDEGKVDENLFSFVLGDADDGELFLGGLDQSKFTGQLAYTPVTQAGCASYPLSRSHSAALALTTRRRLPALADWQVEGKARANGIALATEQMIIDTGTTLILVRALPPPSPPFARLASPSDPRSRTRCSPVVGSPRLGGQVLQEGPRRARVEERLLVVPVLDELQGRVRIWRGQVRHPVQVCVRRLAGSRSLPCVAHTFSSPRRPQLGPD